ncbi:hypothetical protein [Vreelandella maris]|uniref:Uncharacterized protein n=1 Tax=Vreelandella maris TaxID=2729617 RepID=A0A7Y6R9K1_9GAMM|nr:hypothetical protein [Halomonas maris]NVF12713.1 hypothetical protein [Halomonas maris]
MTEGEHSVGIDASNDAHTRARYISQIQRISSTAKADISAGRASYLEAAEYCHAMRNKVMEEYRKLTSEQGLAKAEQIKKTPPSLADLFERYAQQLFGCSYQDLSAEQQQRIHHEVIEASGRSNAEV